MMMFNLAWWGSLLRRRRRTADASGAALPQQHQQQHLQEQEEQAAKRREDGLGTLSARTVFFLELCKPGVSSPFHRCNHVLLLITMYIALLLGWGVGLPWLLLCCWPIWGLRVLSFSWWGLSTVFDIFWLPAAVHAFQQRLKQKYVKEELRRRLREQLKGLNVAAFIGKERHDNVCSDNNIGSSDSSKTNSSPSSREKMHIGKSGSGSGDDMVGGSSNSTSESRRPPAGAWERLLSGRTETAGKIGGETVRERGKEEHEKYAVSGEAAEAAESRESSSFCDSGGSACTEAVRDAGGAAAIAVEKETQQQERPKEQQEKITSVREELQRANILRQQRAAAAATAAAAANAKRLGLTTLADCRHRAGRERLSEEELEQLLREVDAKYEVDAIFAEKKRVRGRQTGRDGAARARSFHSGNNRAVVAAGTPSSPDISPATAAAAPSSSAAGCHESHLAVSDGNHAVAAAVAVATSSTAAAVAEGGGHTKGNSRPAKLCPSSRVTAAAVASCSSLSLIASSSPSSVTAESAPPGTEPLSAAARTRFGQRSSDDSNTGQGGKPLQEENICCSIAAAGREEGGKGERRGICDVGCGSERDKRGWKYLIPWNLIFRGFVAHCQCTYLVDLLFCHAELSPLSSSVPREFLLLLHCLIRGMTVFCVFASPYCYTPYSHLLRTQQLLSALFTCTAVSFGAVGVLSAVPLFVEDLLRPLLRLVLLPETLADSDLLQLLADARLVLPALPPSSTGSTWQMRMDFYEISQLVTLAVITAGAYAAVRLQDTDVRVAAAAKRAYATDLLALLTLQTRQQILTGNAVGDGCGGGAPVVCAVEMCVHSDAAELGGAPLEECMNGCRENSAVATLNRGDNAAEKAITAGVPIVRLEESGPSSVLRRHVANEGTTRRQEATRSIAEQNSEESGGKGMSSEERQRQQTDGTKQRRELGVLGGRKEEKKKLSSRQQRESGKDKTCFFLTLVLAEKVVQERVYLEKSDFELLRARVVKRFLLNGAGAVTACCLLLCWTVVAFLAVSNVAMRLSTPSDILQEREGARLVSAAATAASLFGEKTGSPLGGVAFEDWADEMRLLQEELRVVMNYYRKTQRQHGWLAATVELWERLGEEFTAAREEQRSRHRHQEMNPYTVLGIKPSATGADIKKAYKLLAKQLHPDLLTAVASNKPTTPAEIDAATERMRKINTAYEKLMRRHGGRGGKSST